MKFAYRTESISTPSLSLDYFLVPWDTEIVGEPVAEISRLRVIDIDNAGRDYSAFTGWCEDHKITLCNCRLPQERLTEAMFLEERGFRFIELNYHPRLTGLRSMELGEDDLTVEVASDGDREPLADMAGRIFRHGRFHQDPRVGPVLGNRRYRVWMVNAFDRPQQTVLKCSRGGEIVGFFVVEHPEPDHCFWSLNGLAPGLQGQGLGKRVWKALLRWHQGEGVDTVTTSISSHNIEAFNLYVSLGFRFAEPAMTMHWRPPHARVLT